MIRSRVSALACTFALLGAAPSAQPPAPSNSPPTVRATVEQLAWVAGGWTGTLGDRTIEQHWSAPLAGSIVAMYRSIRNSRPTLYELLAMENEGEGVVLRIKHFAPGPGLVSQEAKDESMDHRLVEVGERRAVFVGGSGVNPVRITFRSPEPDALNITVERQRDGKPAQTEFRYSRITR